MVSVPKFARQATLERDDHECRKCGRQDALCVHHIQHRQDGGTEDLDNLITLCGVCHAEWHALELGSSFPFERFLAAPSLLFLILAWEIVNG